MNNDKNYGTCAIEAVKLNKEIDDPIKSWKLAANSVYDTKSSQDKCCPKNAFLGLCEDGLVRGIKPGIYFKRKKPNLNKKYAITAVKILSTNSNLSKKELWFEVREKLFLGEKSHNSQMDVVLALWENGLIKDV